MTMQVLLKVPCKVALQFALKPLLVILESIFWKPVAQELECLMNALHLRTCVLQPIQGIIPLLQVSPLLHDAVLSELMLEILDIKAHDALNLLVYSLLNLSIANLLLLKLRV